MLTTSVPQRPAFGSSLSTTNPTDVKPFRSPGSDKVTFSGVSSQASEGDHEALITKYNELIQAVHNGEFTVVQAPELEAIDGRYSYHGAVVNYQDKNWGIYAVDRQPIFEKYGIRLPLLVFEMKAEVRDTYIQDPPPPSRAQKMLHTVGLGKPQQAEIQRQEPVETYKYAYHASHGADAQYPSHIRRDGVYYNERKIIINDAHYAGKEYGQLYTPLDGSDADREVAEKAKEFIRALEQEVLHIPEPYRFFPDDRGWNAPLIAM